MFLPPASEGAQGPHGKYCTKAAPPKLPELPGLGMDCSEQQSRCHSVHPPALSSRLPTLRHPRAGHAAPGHTAQRATDKHWDGLQLSLAAANPKKHSHTQRAIMMGLGSRLPLAVGGDPAPCAVLCRHSWPVSLVLGTGEGPPSPVVSLRCSTEPTHLAGWRKQRTSRIPENGVCYVPGAPLWSLGSLRSSSVVTPQEPHYIGASAWCWLGVGGFWPQILGAPGPVLLSFACGALRGRVPASLLGSAGSASPGDRFSLKAAVQGALPPVPKGLTSNFLC